MLGKVLKVLKGIGICFATYLVLYMCLSGFMPQSDTYVENIELKNKQYDVQETLDNYTEENEASMIEEVKNKKNTELKDIETKLNTSKEENTKLKQEVEEMKKTLNN